MLLRPQGIMIDGHLEWGLEVFIVDGEIVELRPHTGIPDAYILSPAFVNAHSHFEYRGLQGQIPAGDYWTWLRTLTDLKQAQPDDQVLRDCFRAGEENRRTGVALVGEHSDRPGSAPAMIHHQLDGVIFQEVITFFQHDDPVAKLESIRARAEQAQTAGFESVVLNPHALFTVDPKTLEQIGQSHGPISLHFAETKFERDLLEARSGPLAAFFRENGVPFPRSESMLGWLQDAVLLRSGVQLVHACDLTEEEIEVMAASGLTVAHCPRSNQALGCPAAPVFEMVRAGIAVGLGMDSAASSGPIDMFAEMRAARAVSLERGRPLSSEQIYRMATRWGAESVPVLGPAGTFGRLGWEIFEGSTVPLIKLHLPNATDTDSVLDHGTPECVEWI